MSELQIKLLKEEKLPYGKAYKEWKDKYTDDRRLFQNIYENLLNSLQEIEDKKIENVSIRCAFTEYMKKEFEVMDRIIERF